MSYARTQTHLFDELERIEVLLQGYLKTGRTPPMETFSSEENDSPQTAAGQPVDPEQFSIDVPETIREKVAGHREEIDRRCAETDDAVTLRLRVIAEKFDLTAPHLDVLLFAVAPHVDEAFETVYSSLHDDASFTEPSVGLVEDLFTSPDGQPSAASTLLGTHSPLRKHDFIRLGKPHGGSSSRRRRPLLVDGELLDYLLGHQTLNSVLTDAADLLEPTTGLDDLHLDQSLSERIGSLAVTANDSPRIHHFYGPDGTEKRRAVQALVDADRMLRADLDALLSEGLLELFHREAMLQDCPVHLTNVSEATADKGSVEPADVPGIEDTPPTLDEVVATLTPLEQDLYLTGEENWTPSSHVRETTYALVEFPKPGFVKRKELWEAHSDEFAHDVETDVLASTFELTQGQIRDAIATARALSEDQQTPLSRESLVEGCKAQSARELNELAEQIEPSADWDDIVLPPDVEDQLRGVAARIKYRGTVYEDWGFEDRFSRGTGVVALFAGPSGTGKTLSAEIIADDAGMDIYKIDLSSVVSKYIGETEENLERIFDAARDSNAILLFDEADAVFGQRAGVSDATDRYANVEVNYLLQRIESYDGVVLLTTNYESNIDEAFMRRIHQTVSFQRPEEDAREEIWRIMFPEDTPTKNLDYEFLAEIDLPGGNIRNAAQTAAIMAASDDSPVKMRHVVAALQRELEKLDRLIDPRDFGEYDHLLRLDSEKKRKYSSESRPNDSAPQSGAVRQDTPGRQSSQQSAENAEPRVKDVLNENGSPTETSVETPPGKPTPNKAMVQQANETQPNPTTEPQSTVNGDSDSKASSNAEGLSLPDESELPPDVDLPDESELPPATDQPGETDQEQPPDESERELETTESAHGDNKKTNRNTATDSPQTPAKPESSAITEPSTGQPDPETRPASESTDIETTPTETEPEAGHSPEKETREESPTEPAKRDIDIDESDLEDLRGAPEMVIEEFFGYLNHGDKEAAHRLYHSKGFAEKFSPREIVILKRQGVEIEGDFERIVDEKDRVVIQFSQVINEDVALLEYELRPEDGKWRIFNYGPAEQQ